MIFGFEKETLEMFGTGVDEALDEMGLADDAPEGAIVEPYEDDTYIGQRYVFERSPLDGAAGSDMSIVRDGDTFVVNGEVDLTDDEEMGEELLESMSVIYAITFPGEVLEHNGRVDGTTVIWEATPGTVLDMHAIGVASGSGQPPADLGGGSDAPGSSDSEPEVTDEPTDTDDDVVTPDEGETDEEPSQSEDDAAAEDSDDEGGIPTWLWIVLGAIILLIIIVVVVIILATRKKKGDDNGNYPGGGAPGGYPQGGYPQQPQQGGYPQQPQQGSYPQQPQGNPYQQQPPNPYAAQPPQAPGAPAPEAPTQPFTPPAPGHDQGFGGQQAPGPQYPNQPNPGQ